MNSREISVRVGGAAGVAGWETTSATSVAQLESLQERYGRFWSAQLLHVQLLGEASPLAALSSRISGLGIAIGEMRARPATDVEVWALAEQADLVERAILDADATVRPAAFRRALAQSRLSDATIVDYLGLIAHRAGRNVAQRDRFVALASQLLFVTNDAGAPVLLSRAEADDLLSRIAQGREAKSSMRESAIAFFHETVQKVHGLTSFDEAVEAGMLVDVIGFKLTLGAEIVDPTILYGIVALEHELWSTLEELCALEGRPRGEPRWLAWKIALRMRNTFRRTKLPEAPEAPEEQRFDEIDWRRFRWRQGVGRLKPDVVAPARFRRATGLYAVLLGVVCFGAFVVVQPASLHVNTLGALPVPEMIALSPLLESGAVSSGDEKVFLGDVSAAAWSAATAEERAAAAARIASGLKSRGILIALVQSGGIPAIQIERGVVVRVTDPKAGS